MSGAEKRNRIRRWAPHTLFALAAVGLFFLAGYDALAELTDSWRKETELELAIEQLELRNDQIEAAIGELAPDGKGVERIARQDLGWAKDDEFVVKIPEKK